MLQKTWAGCDGRAWGGGVAGNPWPALDSNVLERACGRFGGDLSPGGGGMSAST
jgi:hypothetical protein